jgi:aryl carrier-like protein
MAINDSTFPKLTIENWRECTLPKIQGSWNLHLALPSDMDFFVLLSSACGVFGNAGQCSYAAGNTFLDALAQFRTAQGQKTAALDLGILLGEGYVAENKEVMTRLLRMNLLAPTSLDKVFAMFDYYCNPSRSISARESQLCSGYELPVNAKAKGLDVHTTMLTPLFRHMHQIKSSDQLHSTSGNQSKNFRSMFIEAASLSEAQVIASEGLQSKLSRVLGMPVENIELDRQLESYGVDSLVALELRNWMTKEMGADVAVFELLGGSTLADISATIATKSSLRKTN